MMITAIAGMLDGFNENPENRIVGMFQGMFQNFWNASVRALTFGLYDPAQGGWNKDWQKNYYLAHLIDFIDVVQEKGIVAAIENYMTNIFQDEAIRVINQQGGIADFLAGNAEMVQEDGVWMKKINVTDNEKLYLDPNTGNVIGRDYGDVQERGQYGVSPVTGGFGLINGTIEEVSSMGTRMVYYVSGSVVIDKMEVYGTDGSHIQIIAKDPETGLQLNEDGIPLGGIVADFERGKLYEYQYTGDSVDVEINFDNPGVDVQNVVNFDFNNMTNQEKEDFVNSYMLLNGINNRNPYGSPSYMVGFQSELAKADPIAENYYIPLYNDFSGFIDEDDLKSLGWLTDKQEIMDILKRNGYIDENGVLQQKFHNLQGVYSKLDLTDKYADRRKEVYDIMFNKCDYSVTDVLAWLFDAKINTPDPDDEISDKIYGGRVCLDHFFTKNKVYVSSRSSISFFWTLFFLCG